MKLLSFKKDNYNVETVGILHKDGKTVAPISEFGLQYPSMNDLIEKISDEEKIILQQAVNSKKKFLLDLDKIILLAPIPVPKQDIICLGINYKEHAEESARYKKEAFDIKVNYPVYFSKRVNEAVAHKGKIPCYSEIVDSLDYEVELAVVIGKDAKNVSLENAFEYVFGYTILNDMSARNLQTRHSQWYFGKSLDRFTPMGPYIVTTEEFRLPLNLQIQSRVNGELRQNSNTKLLMNGIEYVIHELSQGMTLKAGTIISMGTPSGVGMGFQPPRFLKSGDVVECYIESIGTLTNIIE
jgi:2-keto-4-pentenoate hydratase/2-oxohepta-3-ene-1,7-dioic acid hydratase in catechol pathway